MKSTFLSIPLFTAIVIGWLPLLQPQADETKTPAPSKADIKFLECGCCIQGGAPQTSPIILALDLDKDGQISALEIKNAAQSLLALDTNGDGIISREEMHAHSKFSQVLAGNNNKTPPVYLGVTVNYYVQQMLHKFDSDGDGRLSPQEMTPRMLAILHIIDLNGDGFLTVDELELINDSVRNHKKSGGGGPNP